MNEQIFDALTQETAQGISRRGSLLALGATSLALVLPLPLAAEAKNKKGKNKKKARKRCKQQVAVCQELLTTACEAIAGCVVDDLIPCCSPLADCQSGGALTCYADYFRSLAR